MIKTEVEVEPQVLFTLPLSSSESGVSFLERQGRSWAVVYAAAPHCVILEMAGVQAMKCTYQRACSTQQEQIARDRVVDVGATDWLWETADQITLRGANPIGLRHLMVSFAAGPCYEFICRGFRVEGTA